MRASTKNRITWAAFIGTVLSLALASIAFIFIGAFFACWTFFLAFSTTCPKCGYLVMMREVRIFGLTIRGFHRLPIIPSECPRCRHQLIRPKHRRRSKNLHPNQQQRSYQKV